MRIMIAAAAGLLATTLTLRAEQVDYPALWASATPFHTFLEGVRSRQEQWRTRFANAAIDSAALGEARALPGRRRILAVAEDRCSDSAWAIPYLAKLAAVAPDKLELRVINRREGSRVQAAHLTPDGRRATPTVVVLDEREALIGAWVERPSELQTWFIEHKDAGDAHRHMDDWYEKDAGRSTVREVLAILARTAPEPK